MKTMNFTKMQSLGNDFVVFDSRKAELNLDAGIIRKICDRRFGVGGDMVIVIEPSGKADAFMRIYNADGSEVEACGNATRCIAGVVLAETGKDGIALETVAGILNCRRVGEDRVSVDMGPARTEWDQIPLSHERDTLHLKIAAGPFSDPVGVNIGNPHAVFFTTDVEKQRIENFGPALETHPLFPSRANIEFAEVIDRSTIRMRVWERGCGVTFACGSGACATAVAAVRRGLTGRNVKIIMDGGPLDVEWRENDSHVVMTGGYETVFEGQYFI